MFGKNDLKILEQKGISLEQVKWQIEQFKNGIKPINLQQPAKLKVGIFEIDNVQKYIDIYENSGVKPTKFVPASGAASRMFKTLFEFLEKNEGEQELQIKENKEIKLFFEGLSKFAFYTELNNSLSSVGGINMLIEQKKHAVIIDKLLNTKGMAYGSLPKGLLKFHNYKNNQNRTPFEEHLVEGALYAKSRDNTVNLHFTVSPEHIDSFKTLLKEVVSSYENLYGVKYKIDFSVQKPSTDTIAVNLDNTPFYNSDGTLLFRPGGHGALIENLNSIDSDIIFIKNIDNVVRENLLQSTIEYKKALAGKLIEIRQLIYNYITELQKNPGEELINKVSDFLKYDLNLGDGCIKKSQNNSEKCADLIDRLNRPLRVCGVVKNQGEPGGGPFLVKDENNCISLQIVESSQVDETNLDQVQLLKSSTHFNPVDLVCSVKDFTGKKFDLKKYIDTNTGFISTKSKSGKDLKALELPGLWNGAMAFWNTVFVEVPVETFNPVKTVNDLLGKFHQ